MPRLKYIKDNIICGQVRELIPVLRRVLVCLDVDMVEVYLELCETF